MTMAPRLQSMVSLRALTQLSHHFHFFTFMHWRRRANSLQRNPFGELRMGISAGRHLRGLLYQTRWSDSSSASEKNLLHIWDWSFISFLKSGGPSDLYSDRNLSGSLPEYCLLRVGIDFSLDTQTFPQGGQILSCLAKVFLSNLRAVSSISVAHFSAHPKYSMLLVVLFSII